MSKSIVIRVGPDDPLPSRLSGRVLDALGAPVPNVRIQHGPKDAYTDTDGTYSLVLPSNALPGPITASKSGWTFSAPGFAGMTDRTVYPGPETVGIDFRGVSVLYDITGQVRTSTGQLLAGVVVSDGAGRTERTDANGSFRIRNSDNGIYALSFSKDGYTFPTGSVFIQHGDRTASSVISTGGSGTTPPANTAPFVVTPASADAITAVQTGAWLSITGGDNMGEARLKYTWALAPVPDNAPPGGAVTFPRNETNTNGAKRTLAVFSKAGTYKLRATITDEGDLTAPASATTDVTVTVNPTLAGLVVQPGPIRRVAVNGQQQFTAGGADQFGQSMTYAGALTWTAAGGGSIGSVSGLFSAPAAPLLASAVARTPGGVAGSVTVDVRNPATIAGRRVFYNNSVWDGDNPAADLNDEFAIATDKSALLPGQTAGGANYTSFNKGINGIMVDVSGLWATLAAGDFAFKVGNTADTAAWVDAPAPTTVATRFGDGAGGSARVTLIWSDNAIRNQWLRVTVLANDRTGLATPDVFYFGNLPGESYYNVSTGHFVVNALDSSATQQHLGETATIENLYDHDRNGTVTSADVSVATGNVNSRLIQLLAP